MPNLGTDLALNTTRGNGIDVALGQPRSIMSNPGFWHRGDLGVTLATGVSAWADQAATHGVDVIQATPTDQPAHFTSGGPNNQPYLDSDGVDDFLNDTVVNMTTTAECYKCAVFRFPTTPSANQEIVVLVGPGSTGVRITTDGTVVRCYVWTSAGVKILLVTAPMVIGTWHLAEVYWDGATMSVRMDGGTATTGAIAGTLDFGAASYRVTYTGFGSADVDVAECVMSLANCNDNGERTELLAYFNKRYQQSWT